MKGAEKTCVLKMAHLKSVALRPLQTCLPGSEGPENLSTDIVPERRSRRDEGKKKMPRVPRGPASESTVRCWGWALGHCPCLQAAHRD